MVVTRSLLYLGVGTYLTRVLLLEGSTVASGLVVVVHGTPVLNKCQEPHIIFEIIMVFNYHQPPVASTDGDVHTVVIGGKG